ncbi:unnamed protein product [Pleuronectes platessa]|uniref:Uncharacterized protein n=1 Tax=Pleuronectes platessa TaxID=8262 RepID=A0A9N7TUN5_PLEPL|nr:unnamed protein product [Pleuronectes platessa]
MRWRNDERDRKDCNPTLRPTAFHVPIAFHKVHYMGGGGAGHRGKEQEHTRGYVHLLAKREQNKEREGEEERRVAPCGYIVVCPRRSEGWNLSERPRTSAGKVPSGDPVSFDDLSITLQPRLFRLAPQSEDLDPRHTSCPKSGNVL